MSQANVEIVRENFDQLNRRDWTAVVAAYDEDVVLVAHSSISLDPGVFSGREAVGRWFGDWFRAFGKDYRFEVEETQGVGDRVLVVARHHGRGRTSGVGVEQITANVFSVREGQDRAPGALRVAHRGTRSCRAEGVGDVAGEFMTPWASPTTDEMGETWAVISGR
jgi:ketosteroid isomerase-like protein